MAALPVCLFFLLVTFAPIDGLHTEHDNAYPFGDVAAEMGISLSEPLPEVLQVRDYI